MSTSPTGSKSFLVLFSKKGLLALHLPNPFQTKAHPTRMAEPPDTKAEADAEARRAREAAALRENLRRRKAQARAREAPPAQAEPPKID